MHRALGISLALALAPAVGACDRAAQDVLHLANTTHDGGSAGAGGMPQDAQVDSAPRRVRPPGPPSLDVLIVVDNSGSMMQEQAALKSSIGLLTHELANVPAGQPDLHVAIISSDFGAGGVMITGNPACNRPGGDKGLFDPANKAEACGLKLDPADGGAIQKRYLVSLEHGAVKNFDGDIADVIGCMAQLGTVGCGFEHQLQSMRGALDPTLNPSQADFLRDWADLLVVFLTDEDDCSGPVDSDLYAAGTDSYPNQTANARCAIDGHRCGGMSLPNGKTFSAPLASCDADPAPKHLTSVPTFVADLLARKPTPEQVHVAVIGGQTTSGTYNLQTTAQGVGPALVDLGPSCTSALGEAAPGLRLKAFVDAFGPRGKYYSICDDVATAVRAIAADIKQVF